MFDIAQNACNAVELLARNDTVVDAMRDCDVAVTVEISHKACDTAVIVCA